MAAAVSAQKVVAEILAGRFDGHLTEVIDAIKARAETGDVALCWRLTFDDLEITEENQSISEVQLVEKQTGKSWGRFHPANSATECAAIVAAALIERKGMTAVAAFESLKNRPAVEFVRAVSEYEVGAPPKETAD